MSGCIVWKEAISYNGYSKIGDKYLHRIVAEMYYGRLPDKAVVMHTCDNPPCINPEHLRVGTCSDNVLDSARKGRHRWSKQSHCANGHPFDIENTLPRSDGKRRCRICHRLQNKEWYRRKRAKTR